MKALLAGLSLALVATVAHAAGEDAYFKARNDAIARIEALDKAGQSEKIEPVDKKARAALEKQMRVVVGPVKIKGYGGKGVINLETLYKGEMGFGQLDGLRFRAGDSGPMLLVTSRAVLDRWIVDHKDWWEGNQTNVPQTLDDALNADAFYTQALEQGAAYSRYARFPIRHPEGAEAATALLIGSSQEVMPVTPQSIVVAVVRGGRVAIVEASVAAEVGTLPACDAIWKEAQTKAEQLRDAYQKTEPKDEALFDQSSKVEEAGADAARACFAQNAESLPSYKALLGQAQSIVDGLAAL